MIARVLLVVVAACSSPVARVPAPVAPPASPVTGATQPDHVVAVDGQRRRIEAPHGTAIDLLATTPDAGAAITSDTQGGVRLWPALDGSVEPRVVDLPRPRALAIAVAPQGFLIAAIDEVGGLVLQVVDRDGLTVQRALVPADPAFAGIAITSKGPLAWRSDHVLVEIASDGRILGELPLEAGQRMRALTVRGDVALAVVERAPPAGMQARWITVTPKLRWGSWIPGTQDAGLALLPSPGGTRIASVRGARDAGRPELVVTDATSGAVLAVSSLADDAAIGFVDEQHVAIAAGGSVGWVDLQTSQPRAVTTKSGDVPLRALMGSGGGKIVTAWSGHLVIATPTTLEFLGYEIESPAVAAPGSNGTLLVGTRDTFAVLDANLDPRATPDLGIPDSGAVSSLRHLGGNDWLVQWTKVDDGKTSIDLVDVATPSARKSVRANLTEGHVLAYEPSTKLVTLSFGATPEILRFDPKQRTLTTVASLPRARTYEAVELVPVRPDLAGGTQLVVAHANDRNRVRWVRDARKPAAGTELAIAGSVIATDRAGHVYTWEPKDGGVELVVYRDGKRVRAREGEQHAQVAVDPTGSRIAIHGPRGLLMTDASGAALWSHPITGVAEVLWHDDGTLTIVGAGGLARVDATTGVLRAARCGFRFTRTVQPLPLVTGVEPMCAALR